ncbi:MAG: hypothetical protein ACFFFG_05500 [Candidatus Thorarchaeota archaeon]
MEASIGPCFRSSEWSLRFQMIVWAERIDHLPGDETRARDGVQSAIRDPDKTVI